MNRTGKIIVVAGLALAILVILALKNGSPSAPPPTPGAAIALPRLVDLGSDKCIPCKMMMPVLEELKREYAGRLQVEIIDVYKNQAQAEACKIETIPTQLFQDSTGKELFRHTGFISKDDILAKWKELGINLGVPEKSPSASH